MTDTKNFAGLYVVLTLVGFAVGLVVGDTWFTRDMHRHIEEMLAVPNPNELPQWVREKHGDSEAVRKCYAQNCERFATLANRVMDHIKSRSFRHRFRDCWWAYLIVGGLGAGGGALVASVIRIWQTS